MAKTRAKLMTNRELELFRVAVSLAKQLKDACPDVGMGPCRETLAREVAERLSFSVDDDDIYELCEEIQGSQ